MPYTYSVTVLYSKVIQWLMASCYEASELDEIIHENLIK